MAWWPSSRGLTGFASAVLRALFDGFDGMVASGAAARYQSRGRGSTGRRPPGKFVKCVNKLWRGSIT